MANDSAAPRPPDQGRLLIADDEPAFARPLAELFRRDGFTAEAVADGDAVRARLAAEAFDVLLCDINMPGNAALEIVQEIAQGGLGGVPVILLTGSPTVATAAHAVQLGAMAYLLKPVEFDDLLPPVRKAVTQSRMRRVAHTHRQHLADWLRQIDAIEAALRGPDPAGNLPGDFVTMSLNNLMAALVDFRRATDLVSAANARANTLWEANTVRALQKSIDVLERTRRNFKSTELRDLRHEFQGLLDAFEGRPPANPAPPEAG